MSKLNLQAVPYQMYGFTEGSNSPMTSALANTKLMNSKQSNLNAVGGKRFIRGGDNGSVTVPQFMQIGPNVSPINANSSSIQTNTTSIATKNNAVNDYYAFLPSKTGGKRKIRSMHRKSKHRKSMHRKSKSKHRKSKSKHRKSKSKVEKYYY